MSPLAGQRVLVVEDEPILAMSTEDMLSDLGCVVVGPAMTTSHAETLVREKAIDGAVIDINMGGTTSFGVARMLMARRVPFCFATGYGAAGVPAEMADAPVLPKPYTQKALARILETLLR